MIQVENAGPGAHPPIAIIGMACDVPGARDVDEFLAMLRREGVAIADVEEQVLVESGVSAEERRRPDYVARRGVIADPFGFDPDFFGLTASEALSLDPQQRRFFRCAWVALEDASKAAAADRRGVGVWAASSQSTYEHVRSGGTTSSIELQELINHRSDHVSTRLSYLLDLHGPSMTVGTSCSSSLVAVIQAIQALAFGLCDVALAGGTSISSRTEGYRFEPGSIMSRSGRCLPFSADADGTVSSDGVGIVAMRRLDDAVRDGDNIRAVIRGFGIDNDGSQKVGYTAPSVGGQIRAIRSALAAAGLQPRDVSLIEAHGTATSLGDPIEFAALSEVMTDGFTLVSAVKGNLGHLSEAAGVVGLIKAVLAVEHGEMYATPGLSAPNPAVVETSHLRLARTGDVWPQGCRRAGVSSFGIGGTNAHVVLEEAPRRSAGPVKEAAPIVVSARSEDALRLLQERVASALEGQRPAEALGMAASLVRGRSRFRLGAAGVWSDGKVTWFAQDRGERIATTRTPARQGDLRAEFLDRFPALHAIFDAVGGDEGERSSDAPSEDDTLRALKDIWDGALGDRRDERSWPAEVRRDVDAWLAHSAALRWWRGSEELVLTLFDGVPVRPAPAYPFDDRDLRIRGAARDTPAGTDGSAAEEVPTRSVTAVVTDAWDEALGVEATAESDFFDDGGTSFSALFLVGAIERELGIAIEPSDVYGASRLGELVALIEAGIRDQTVSRSGQKAAPPTGSSPEPGAESAGGL